MFNVTIVNERKKIIF